MARQAPGLIVSGGTLGVAMRVVAGDAVKSPRALGVAAAPGKGRALESNPVRIGPGKAWVVMQGMALGAEAQATLERLHRARAEREALLANS